MITSPTEIYNILRSIVIHDAPQPCGRLNCFAVIDRIKQLNATNAEMTYKHYTDGLFWARDWYNGGADPSKLAKEYDILMVEAFKSFRKVDMQTRSYIFPLYLTIAGQIQCEACPGECSDTIEGKRLQLADKMNKVLAELLSYEKYEITPATGAPFTGWATPGQVEALLTAGTWTTANATGWMLDASIQAGELEVYVPLWNSLSRPESSSIRESKDSLVDNVAAITAQINFQICTSQSGSFRYEIPDVDGLGVVKC